MRKVLILTTSTGQGHNQAAKSLQKVFENKGFSVDNYDFIEGKSALLNNVINKGYELLASKVPFIYGFIYNITDKKSTNRILPSVFIKAEKKLYNRILEEKPDIIIGTHPLSVNLVTNLKRKNLINIPFISVVTDFMVHYSYIEDLVDSYITASEASKEYLQARGVNKDIIFPYGIPISPIFFQESAEVIEVKDKEFFNILLMGGSMGLDNISQVLKELIKNKNKLRITVVCGNNQILKTKLLSNYSNKDLPNKKLHILGFTNDISSIMDYSDIIISKPGGLTVTESIAKVLPIIIPFAIPGQEVLNTGFLTNEGCAIYVKDIHDINSNVNLLLENPDVLNNMKENIRKIRSNYSIERILSLSENLINTKNSRN